jgi:hypothetical protein
MRKILLVGIIAVAALVLVAYLALGYRRLPDPIPAGSPAWMAALILREEAGPAANPPASLSKCTYGGQTVYYLPPRCCDVGSVLYSETGDAICSPDGGFTGRGDGKCPDFAGSKQSCVVIWQDTRR